MELRKYNRDNRGLAENKSFGNKLCSQQLLLSFNTACRQEVPAAGNRNGTSLNNQGSNGNYWSGTLNENNSNNAWNLNFNNGNHNLNNNNRNNGFTVRPVEEIAQLDTVSVANEYKLSKLQLLVDLFRAYKDARKHKRKTIKQVEFEMNMEQNLVELRDKLWNRTYKPGRSVCFIICEPKKREIFAAEFRDRIVHHLYYNYTYELFERIFITDSYSCRKNKGTHFGVRRLEHHIRSCSENYKNKVYILKCDIKGYFMNIDRKKLLKICENSLNRMACHKSDVRGKKWIERIDYDFIKYLGREIILNDPVENCIVKGRQTDWDDLPASKSLFKTAKGSGLPIGNLTSQLFSNVYMNAFDQFIKRQCREKYYGRYVDDAYVVSRDKTELRYIISVANEYLYRVLGLKLHPDKTYIRRAGYGFEFLGVYVKPFRVYIRNSTKKRIANAISNLKYKKDINISHVVNSYLGILSHYKSYKIRKEIFADNLFLNKYGSLDSSLLKFNGSNS